MQGHLSSSHETLNLPKPPYPCHLSNGNPCTACRKLEHLESQIAEAKTALDTLLNQHRQARTEINEMHNPIIHRVPQEIASHIFEIHVSEESPDLFSPQFVEITAPLVLGAVCRTWRHIVWATPRLWSSISISLRSLPKIHVRCKLVKQWLSRSGQLPLSISVYLDIFHEFRWQYLGLAVPAFLVPQFSGDSQGVSILKGLRILPLGWLFGGFALENGEHNPSKVDVSYLRLRSIEIGWNNATCVKLGSLRVDECLELLRRAPKLIHCNFDSVLPTQDYFMIPVTPFVHDILQELYFTPCKDYEHDSDVYVFFDKLLAPALQKLHYNSDGQGVLPSAALIPFLQRSSCRLRELYSIGTLLDDVHLIPLLRTTPSIEYLCISPGAWAEYSPNDFFRLLGATSTISLDATEHEDTFLPKLRSFKYFPSHKVFDWTFVPDIFGPISEIKNPQRRPLHSLSITFRQYDEDVPYPFIGQDTLPRLDELEDAGIFLQFTEEFSHNDLIESSIAHYLSTDEVEEEILSQSNSDSSSPS